MPTGSEHGREWAVSLIRQVKGGGHIVAGTALKDNFFHPVPVTLESPGDLSLESRAFRKRTDKREHFFANFLLARHYLIGGGDGRDFSPALIQVFPGNIGQVVIEHVGSQASLGFGFVHFQLLRPGPGYAKPQAADRCQQVQKPMTVFVHVRFLLTLIIDWHALPESKYRC